MNVGGVEEFADSARRKGMEDEVGHELAGSKGMDVNGGAGIRTRTTATFLAQAGD